MEDDRRENYRSPDERRRARIRAKYGPMKTGLVEPKTNCRFCYASFLVVTAQRTGGFCMRHSRMGMPFVKRLGTTIVRRESSDLETARREFHTLIPQKVWKRHWQLLEWHWKRFEDAVKPGDTVRRFTSYPSDLQCKIYAKQGFICERSGEIIEGVLSALARNAIAEMEDRSFFAACASSKELSDQLLGMPFEEEYDSRWEEYMH